MDEAGNVVGRHDYLPFGEEVTGGSAGRNSQFGAADGVNQKFTGQERDWGTVPNLDYFYARYFNGEQGRFLSPDPENAGADPLNPQSWNGYSYGLNSPLQYADPSGMTTCDSNGNNCHDETAVTAQAQGLSPLDQLLYRSLFYSLTPLMQVGQQTQQVTQTAADWLSEPQGRLPIGQHGRWLNGRRGSRNAGTCGWTCCRDYRANSHGDRWLASAGPAAWSLV